MRRRITIAFVAVLAVALVFSGGVSLLLIRHAASENAQRTLLAQVRSLAANAKTLPEPNVLNLALHVGGIDAAQILVVNSPGRLKSPALANIPTANLDLGALVHGRAISGSHNHLAYAVVPLFSEGGSTVALAIESRESFSSDSIGYFLLASGISLLVSFLLASVVTRQIARRVNAVAEAAGHIAAGEFATRVAVNERDYPELVDLNSSINAMAADLERARDAERDFLLSISHDLRTPLTSIRGYSEAIAEGAIDDVAHAAAVVVAESDRLGRLIDDLLDLARLRARRFSFDPGPFELVTVIRTTTEALPLHKSLSGVGLSVNGPDHPVTIVADLHRVGQIVANLVENALKFATSQVGVDVSTVLEGGEELALIVVEDDGPGIAPADLPRIFEPLYTSDREPAKAGTGLGLAIVEELTVAMGGRVDVDSPARGGKGARFCVRLPLRPPVDGA